MKKNIICLLLLLFVFSWQAKAQVTTFPWSEDFEGATFPSNGWTKELPGSQSGSVIGQSSYLNNTPGGQYSAMFYSDSTRTDQYLFSKQIHVTAPYTELTFWHIKSSNHPEIFEWGISTNGPTYSDVTTWTAVSHSNTNWQKEIVYLTDYIGQDIYISWHYYGTNGFAIYLDDIKIDLMASCPNPSNLTASNIRYSQAELSWQENGSATNWNIEYGYKGFIQGNGTMLSGVTSNPYLLTGLSTNTRYDFYIQADCGGGDTSDWVGPFSFTTPPQCGETFYDPGGPNGVYPSNLNMTFTIYPDNPNQTLFVTFNDFDMVNSGDGMMVYDGPDTNAPLINSGSAFDQPACPRGAWTGGYGDPYTAYGHTFTSTHPSGTLTFVFTSQYGGFSGWEAEVSCISCFAPSNITASNITPTQADLSWTENNSATNWNIEYGPTGFSQGQGTVIATSNNPYTLTGLSPETSYDYYVQTDCGGGDTSLWSGPYTFTTPPTCLPPTNLSVSNINANQVEVSWTENGSATSWDIEYGPEGFTLGQGTQISVTTNPYTLTGLNSLTSYDIYVRADCGGGDTSHWLGPNNFITTCGTISTFPFSYGFEDTTPNEEANWTESCWSANPENTGITGYNYPYRWTSDNGNPSYTQTGPVSPHGGNIFAYTEGPGSTNGEVAELISPELDLSSLTNPQLSFYYFMFGEQIGSLSVDFYDGTSWINDMGTLIGQQQTTNSEPWRQANLIIPNIVTKIRFRAIAYTGFRNIIAIDDIVIEESPSCPNPYFLSASNITYNSADLSWVQNGSATAWNIEYGPRGFTQGQGTVITGITSNPYTLTGLTPISDYDYYVQKDCGGGNSSSWIGPYPFTTVGSCGFFRVDLYNAFSQGWQGTSLTIYRNGISIMNITLHHGYGPESHYFPVNIGDILSFDYIGSDYDNGYNVYDESGNLIIDETTIYTPEDYGDPSIPSGWIACGTQCPPPNYLSVSNVQTHQATLSWTEHGPATTWNIEYGPHGYTQGQGTLVTGVTSNPYTLTGIDSATDYDFYVQSDCSPGYASSWSQYPERFMTLPECGDTFYDDGGPNEPYSSGLDQTFTIYPDNPGEIVSVTFNHFNMVNGNDGMMVYNGPDTNSPYFDSGSRYGNNNNNYYCPDGAWTGPPGHPYSADGHTFSSTDPSGALTFLFRSVSSWPPDGWEATVTCSSCPIPSDLAVSNITTSQAELSWTDYGTATSWNIEYGPAGFVQGQGTLITGITSNPYILTGLSSFTDYDFYVQADCGNETSLWAGPVSFKTHMTCGSTFYDDGGPNGNYSPNLNETFTIYPETNGEMVTVTFNSFNMEHGIDGMMVYNGPDTNAPLFSSGSYYGRNTCPNGAWTGGPGTTFTAHGHSFTSTDPSGTLTFSFKSNGSIQRSGWNATATCAPQAISENQISGLIFYPNPVNHDLNLSANDPIESVTLTDITGQEVLHMTPNDNKTQINMSKLPNGVYFVKVRINGELTAFKIVKK